MVVSRLPVSLPVTGCGSQAVVPDHTHMDNNMNYYALDLKDDNLHLRERNHALVGYIDTLLLNIIESKPDILEVKPFRSNTSLSVNSSVTV